MVPPVYHKYRTVFEEETSQALPPRRQWDHAINLKPDAHPSNNCKIYPLNLEEQGALDVFLEDMTKRSYIRPSQSPFASPFFFVKKKDGKLHPVQDYRQLNAMTIKNQYPLPLISNTIDKLKDARIFLKFDVRWGYNNMCIKEGDEWKAAFKTNRGMFEPLMMFFGLMNSPVTFQSMMNELFKDLIDSGKVFIYMDDILITTATLEEHQLLVQQVLERLCEHHLILKPEKCEFEKAEVEYLGMKLRGGCIAMDPIKFQGLAEWPAPMKLRDVCAFLGFAGFYQHFIRNFSRFARPLNDLTKKGTSWHWDLPQQHTFDLLKKHFTKAPVLIQPNPHAPFRLECDTSKSACGAVLSQVGEDGLWHPVAFMSKSFIEAERNYNIYDWELLAIIKALEEWRHYLEGSPHQIKILSDHKNLEIFKEACKLSR
jgi:RNase H-like domain found in reverse transcriptase/Reverse transcriptase (RNA-dependent DNA polymerase)